MGNALTVNSIPVPVATFTRQPDIEGGGRSRSLSFQARQAVRAVKAKWAGTTTIQDHRTTIALRGLLRGDGHVISFEDNDLYTSRAMWPVLPTTGLVWGQHRWGTYGLRVPQTSNVQWAFGYTREWTIACYKANADLGGWHHYVLTSSGELWVDGFPLITDTSWMTVVGGNLKFTAPAGANDMAIDDVLCVPYLVPETWPAALYARAAALPALPFLEVAGDLMPSTMPFTCSGEAGAGEFAQAVFDGAWAQNLSPVAFTLEEK